VTESTTESRSASGIMARRGEARFAAALLALLSFFVLFHHLGGAALFDPDEGRNAEVAREILVTGDWITPYYDFLPRPEKPVFFYSLTALSYKLFGVSEAAARLPSALAALAILLLTWVFVYRRLGARAALWSGLVLVTAVQFYAFSRIVILDMTLAFFITLALFAYYQASTAESRATKRARYFLMYAAVGGATLVKGPIGFVFPGMIVLAYIVVKRNWSALLEMELVWGIVIFLLIVAPWYAWTEARDPGYLAYFLGQEHFARYLTPYYHRTKPWYYFFGVLAVGFLPWTTLLAAMARRLWKNTRDDLSLYLLVWALVPFIFFSFSRSKMSEYLLPIYPALAILAGRILAEGLKRWEARLLALTWQFLSLSFLYLLAGVIRPEILPIELRAAVGQMATVTVAALTLLAFVALPWTGWVTWSEQRERLFPLCCATLFLLFFVAHRFVESFAMGRSYKELAARSAPLLSPGDQLVVYDTHLPSLPFYLGVRKPIWIVTDETADEIMGSFYLAAKKPSATLGHGKILFTFEEFAEEWSRRKLMVFVKEKRLSDFDGAKVLLRSGGVTLITNQ
jgi:4-amino-4-deoxy-L-arabinose transferase-like glycosyltransferase